MSIRGQDGSCLGFLAQPLAPTHLLSQRLGGAGMNYLFLLFASPLPSPTGLSLEGDWSVPYISVRERAPAGTFLGLVGSCPLQLPSAGAFSGTSFLSLPRRGFLSLQFHLRLTSFGYLVVERMAPPYLLSLAWTSGQLLPRAKV